MVKAGSYFYAFRERFGLNFESIGVAPITLITHVRNKNSNIQGRSLNVIKVIFHTTCIKNCS